MAMNSPFPGMDPYLEAHWLDVHARLIVEAATTIQGQLGDDLVARIEERLLVEDAVGPLRRIGPDVRIVEFASPGAAAPSAGGIALAEPVVFHVPSEPIRQRFIEIIDIATGGRVVTVIEFVSPSNKLPGDGLEQYRRKQTECRYAKVSLVEIDLTRRGRRALMVHGWTQARLHESDYQASVWRAAFGSQCALYKMSLRKRLPAIPIPLRTSDPDAVLDIQAMVDQAYASARYDRTIDYSQPCDPPLEEDHARWADELLKAAGKR